MSYVIREIAITTAPEARGGLVFAGLSRLRTAPCVDPRSPRRPPRVCPRAGSAAARGRQPRHRATGRSCPIEKSRANGVGRDICTSASCVMGTPACQHKALRSHSPSGSDGTSAHAMRSSLLQRRHHGRALCALGHTFVEARETHPPSPQGACALPSSFVLVVGHVGGEPVEAFVQSVARGGAAALDVTAARDVRRVELHQLRDLGGIARAGQVLLVGEDEQQRVVQLLPGPAAASTWRSEGQDVIARGGATS